jgi:pyruvate ferredoxin oxidoreductase beta subunit
MFPVAIRQVLANVNVPVVISNATGCMEVTTTLYPYTAWRTPYIHLGFENSATVMSGVEAAYRSLKKQGKIDKDIRFIAWGGDGASYDIGLQWISGAMERGHRMLYICYDNQAYENTGIQRSSATPRGAGTTTTPVGKESDGKKQWRKDLTQIMAAHYIPYVAQTAVSHWNDLSNKVRKALDTDGPSFMNILAPCRLGWSIPPEESFIKTKEAVETCFWPLYEVENGRNWRLTYKPKEKLPYNTWLRNQGRFKHLFDGKHEELLAELQSEVDVRWDDILKRCGEPVAPPEASGV